MARLRSVVRRKVKSDQPRLADEEFDAGVRAVEPRPNRAGHREGDGERIEKDGAPDRLAAHFLVDGDGEAEPDQDREDDIEGAEQEQVAVGDDPALVRPDRHVMFEADELIRRQQRGVRQRDVERPDREDEDIDEARQERGRQHDERRRPLQPLAQRRPRGLRGRYRRIGHARLAFSEASAAEAADERLAASLRTSALRPRRPSRWPRPWRTCSACSRRR